MRSLGFYICRCSVTKLCLTLWDPVDCGTRSFRVLHHLLEFAPVPVHWIGAAIQPSHPLLPPSPALNLSQHQSLSQRVSSACVCVCVCVWDIVIYKRDVLLLPFQLGFMSLLCFLSLSDCCDWHFWWASLAAQMSGESGHPCLAPSLRGNIFSFSPLMMFAVGLSFYYVEVCSLSTQFVDNFCNK